MVLNIPLPVAVLLDLSAYIHSSDVVSGSVVVLFRCVDRSIEEYREYAAGQKLYPTPEEYTHDRIGNDIG